MYTYKGNINVAYIHPRAATAQKTVRIGWPQCKDSISGPTAHAFEVCGTGTKVILHSPAVPKDGSNSQCHSTVINYAVVRYSTV